MECDVGIYIICMINMREVVEGRVDDLSWVRMFCRECVEEWKMEDGNTVLKDGRMEGRKEMNVKSVR